MGLPSRLSLTGPFWVLILENQVVYIGALGFLFVVHIGRSFAMYFLPVYAPTLAVCDEIRGEVVPHGA